MPAWVASKLFFSVLGEVISANREGELETCDESEALRTMDSSTLHELIVHSDPLFTPRFLARRKVNPVLSHSVADFNSELSTKWTSSLFGVYSLNPGGD